MENVSISGTAKLQNGCKTTTAIPTIYHNLIKDSIEFGPIVGIFEAGGGKFSPQFNRELKSVGLNRHFSAKRDSYIDASTNAWQHEKNMSASERVLAIRKYAVLTLAN